MIKSNLCFIIKGTATEIQPVKQGNQVVNRFRTLDPLLQTKLNVTVVSSGNKSYSSATD